MLQDSHNLNSKKALNAPKGFLNPRNFLRAPDMHHSFVLAVFEVRATVLKVA